jgi:uncharacterized protein (DUF58 family)
MLPVTDWSKLGDLMFQARRLVDGLYAGRHLSPQPGPGIDFFDYRQYSSGDPIASVDWKLLGRTDRPYIRRYRRHTDMHVHLLVDVSASMRFARLEAGRGGDDLPSKQQAAAALAAAIAMLAVRQADRVGMSLFGAGLTGHIPASGGWAHLQRVVHALEHAPQPQGAGDIGAAIRQCHALLRRRGLIIVISDLLDEPADLFDGMSRLRHDRFEVIAFQVLSPAELGLSGVGAQQSLKLIDQETQHAVHAQIGQVRQRYTQMIESHVAAIAAGCAARGADHHLVRTDRGVMAALRDYLVRRWASMA